MPIDLELVVQLAGVGLVIGGSYALVALGLTLVFGILHVINFAHGEFYMLGAFVAYTLTVTSGLPYLLALPVTMLIVGLIGYAVSSIVVTRLSNRHETAMLLGTLGLSQVLLEGAQLIWS